MTQQNRYEVHIRVVIVPDQVVVVSTDSHDKAVDQAKGMVSDVLERFHNLQPKDYTMNVLRVTHNNRGA